MTFKEFCKKYDDIKMKYDIIVLSELIILYKEYGKEKTTTRLIFNELHDYINYSEEEENYIIKEAEKRSKDQCKR